MSEHGENNLTKEMVNNNIKEIKILGFLTGVTIAVVKPKLFPSIARLITLFV